MIVSIHFYSVKFTYVSHNLNLLYLLFLPWLGDNIIQYITMSQHGSDIATFHGKHEVEDHLGVLEGKVTFIYHLR